MAAVAVIAIHSASAGATTNSLVMSRAEKTPISKNGAETDKKWQTAAIF